MLVRFLRRHVALLLPLAITSSCGKKAEDNDDKAADPAPVPSEETPGEDNPVQAEGDQTADLAADLSAIRAAYELPALGGVYAVAGKPVASVMTGVRKLGDAEPATLGDKFHLGSCTKAMTATLAAILIEQGKLAWTSTLGELFPEITSMHTDYKSVTLEMLLAHRGGTPIDLLGLDGGSLWDKLWEDSGTPAASRQTFTETILTRAPEIAPGSAFAYNNAGYMIAGAALEKLAGKSFEDLLTSELFVPLGMGSCGFGAPGDGAAAVPDQPWPHEPGADGKLQPLAPQPGADNPSGLTPAGRVHCTAADWLKFLTLQIDGFHGEATPVLHKASFTKLHTSYPGQEYTYGGWFRTTAPWSSGPVFNHAGSNTLNYVNVWLDPTVRAVVLTLSNAGNDKAAAASHEVVQRLLDYKRDGK